MAKTEKPNLGIVISAALLLVGLSACERGALDEQMERLCQKDGGVKVYETIALPDSEFNEYGEPLTRFRRHAITSADYYGPDYYYFDSHKIIVGENHRGRKRGFRVGTWPTITSPHFNYETIRQTSFRGLYIV